MSLHVCVCVCVCECAVVSIDSCFLKNPLFWLWPLLPGCLHFPERAVCLYENWDAHTHTHTHRLTHTHTHTELRDLPANSMFYRCLPSDVLSLWIWCVFALYRTVMYCIYAHIVQLYREGVWCVCHRRSVLFILFISPRRRSVKDGARCVSGRKIASFAACLLRFCITVLLLWLEIVVYRLMLGVLLAIIFWHSTQRLKEYFTINWKFNHCLTFQGTG